MHWQQLLCLCSGRNFIYWANAAVVVYFVTYRCSLYCFSMFQLYINTKCFIPEVYTQQFSIFVSVLTQRQFSVVCYTWRLYKNLSVPILLGINLTSLPKELPYGRTCLPLTIVKECGCVTWPHLNLTFMFLFTSYTHLCVRVCVHSHVIQRHNLCLDLFLNSLIM